MLQAYLDFLYSIVTFIPFTVLDGVVLVGMIIFLRQEKASGFTSSLITMVKYVSVLLLALFIYPFLSNGLSSILPIQVSTVHLIVLVVLIAVFYIIAWNIEKRLSLEDERADKRLDYLSYITGTVAFLILVTAVSAIVLLSPASRAVKQLFTDSLFGGRLTNTLLVADITLRNITGTGKGEALNFMATSSQSVAMHSMVYTVDKPVSLQEETGELFTAINTLRAEQRLPLLLHNSQLSEISKQQGVNLALNGVVAGTHVQEYSLYDRLQAGNYFYMNASEITTQAYSVSNVVSGLSSSASFRELILSTSFQSVGVAVIEYGNYGNLYVLTFVQ